MNPLRGSCVSTRSRCGAARVRFSLGEPAEIVRVEALSLRRRAGLLLAKWPFARLLSQSRVRGFDSPLVHGSSGSSKEAVVCGVYSRRLRPENRNPEAQTYSARSTSTAELRLSILRTDTSAERLAERNLHRATCTDSLKTDVEPLARSSLQRATCAQQPGTMRADTAMFPLVGR